VSYATDCTLEALVIQAEQRSALAARPPCGVCQTEFFSQVASTFCGDCGVELCSNCAEKFAMETYCPFCCGYAKVTAVYPC
jgi:hypothetical protein